MAKKSILDQIETGERVRLITMVSGKLAETSGLATPPNIDSRGGDA